MKIYSFLFLVILSSCTASKIATKTGIDEIHFGSGGGFTGEVKTYTLTADSKLFENGKELKKITSKKTAEIFNEAKELTNYNFKEPDNIYSFIEIKGKDKTNRIVWPFGSLSVDKRATELHSKLISTVK